MLVVVHSVGRLLSWQVVSVPEQRFQAARIGRQQCWCRNPARPPMRTPTSALSLLLALMLPSGGASTQGAPVSPTTCQRADGRSAPCGPGNDLCHSPGYGTDAPQFHVRDYSCGMNDPAAVVYDPVHSVYHDHWEKHVAAPGGQYTRGHAVSRDMIHWARMPVSLWNDRPYDSWAIFTGSATVVDGKVVQIYPGLCHGKPEDGCPGATNLAIAVRTPLDTCLCILSLLLSVTR